ncbi:MAG: CoA transferase [Alphaproteobacteria bacterium]|jgi:crotonobetainyl-CoA:carnitine CoA-transferase CaiB-like acyl-CoA transferase|nr:CoA transferase [Alphaproteobacteria bacterium]MDP6813305.1 CoA transferase [Alphaproteobacteria bacterium]
MPGPLAGIRILDLTSVGFGPYGAQILGDYGAEVIKVEAPEGDITRGIAPFRNEGMGPFFLNANRNKRCLALDLKQPKGRDALLKLVETADVLISSIRPAAMGRLGLGYDDCRRVNGKLIYVALVGFGQDGPYARRPAYDDIIQGLSGMAGMQGGRDGPPRFVNASICDKICSQFAAHATIAALFSRERTGAGQLVEVPMLESLIGFNMVEHNAGHTFEPPLGPAGYERSMVEYRRPYPTADGYICVLPYNTKQWQTFFRLMERPDMLDDPLVTDGKVRSENIGALYEMVADCVRDWPTDRLLAALEEADIPNGRVTALDDLADDEHLRAVGLFQHFEHPTEGRIRLAGPGVRFSETPQDIRSLPAQLGEHSVDVLSEAGLSAEDIEGLLEAGITVDGRLESARSAAD